MLRKLMNVMLFMAIACLIVMQRDADGAPLIDDWRGLLVALVLAGTGALFNALHEERR